MMSVAIDIDHRMNRFDRGQLRNAWLDIIEDDSDDEKHTKIKDLLDAYWASII